MPVPRSRDHLAIALVCLFTVMALAVGFRNGDHFVDVDQRVYEHTLLSMQHGQGYYPAMRAALVEKEGAPPTQIRSVRTPTLFLLLYRFPADSWRWLVGVVFLAALVLAWRLGRPLATLGGPVAVVLMGIWLMGASPVVYLHAELWGLPLVLGAALALRNERWAAAALLLGLAAVFRETYVVAFAAGLIVTGRRRSWWPALVGLGALGALHAWQAGNVLAAHGQEAPFGASGLGLSYILSAVSPGDRPFAWTVGIVGGLLGAFGARSRWNVDRGANLVLLVAAALAPATILIGRQYWCLTFGPALACFAAAGPTGLASSVRALRSRNDERGVEHVA